MDLNIADAAFAITGGTDGLGLALAHVLIEEGARVAICGRNQERLNQAVTALGSSAIGIRADVTVRHELESFIDVTHQTFGRLDGLVNNAGRANATAVADATDEEWQADFELKVLAAMRASRHALPYLEERGGAILNVLSITARTPSANTTPTSASRAAGLALTKALASEVGPRGIRVNALLVGLIQSGQWERRSASIGQPVEDFYQAAAADRDIALGRFGTAQEFADVAAFLLSPRASYVTGAGLSIDGGLSPVI